MMSAVEPSTVSQPPVSERPRADVTQAGESGKPYGDRHHKSVIVPGIFKGPILPKWARKLFRRDVTPAAR
jgi:hypothetical protein